MAATMHTQRTVPTLVLAGLFVATLVTWGHQRSSEAVLGEQQLLSDGLEPRAARPATQSLAQEAVGRILQHHAPAAAAPSKTHPDYWPGVSFFAKRREQAWEARKAAAKHNAMQQELREQAPRGPEGQKLSAKQASIAAKFNALSGASSTQFSSFRTEYEQETGHKAAAVPPPPAHKSHTRKRAAWGSRWNMPEASATPRREESREAPRREERTDERRGFQQALEGEGGAPRPKQEPPQRGETNKEAALEAEVDALKKQLGHVEGEVQQVRHGYEGGMHVEGGSTRHGAIWDGGDRRDVAPSSLQEAAGGGVAMGAEGEKDYDKYGVELDKYKDPTPLHYRDDVAGGVQIHSRDDEIRKIHEYQAKIAEEQGKMKDDWKKIMESPPDVTGATRPDIMDPDSFPTEGEAFHKKYHEMKDFKAAIEAFNHDPQFNPMIVLKAHHLVKYGIPAPESDNIYVWRQWYRETLDKYHVVRHQVTDMASGKWHDYDTDWDIHGIHRPGAYKKVWRTRDNWGPGKPHTPLVTSPNANFTLTEGGGVAEEEAGGQVRNETAAEMAEAEAQAPGGAGEEAGEAMPQAQTPEAEAPATEEGAGEESIATEGGEDEAGAEELGAEEKAPVAALANKVDNLEKKLDQVVNLLEASHGEARPAGTLRVPAPQRLAQQHHPHIRKAFLPSASERDRLAHPEEMRKRGTSTATKGKVLALAATKKAPTNKAGTRGTTSQQVRAAATAAARAALKSEAKRASTAEDKILSHPPKSVLNWLASAFQAAGNDPKLSDANPSTVQSLSALKKPPPPPAPAVPAAVPAAAATAAASAPAATHTAVPKGVAKMIKRGTWENGAQTPSVTPVTTALKKGPALYNAADASKDAAAVAAAKKAISAAESVADSPDSVDHKKTASKNVMQTGPDPSLAAKANNDPLKRVTKAILVDHGSTKAQAAQAIVRQGSVDPDGTQYSAPVPKTLTKKFVGGRTMYVPKYDHTKAGGDGWGWLW